MIFRAVFYAARALLLDSKFRMVQAEENTVLCHR